MAAADDELFGAEHVRVYRETDGQRGYHWRGTTVLLLTRTAGLGRAAHDPLIHRTDGDRWVIVASRGGAPRTPAGTRTSGPIPGDDRGPGEEIPVLASTAAGEERGRLWSLLAEVWPAYDGYQAKTDREIPVVVLTAAGSDRRSRRIGPGTAFR